MLVGVLVRAGVDVSVTARGGVTEVGVVVRVGGRVGVGVGVGVGVRVAVRVEVGVRVIVTLPNGTGKVAVRVVVGTSVAVNVGLDVEVGVDVADKVTVGVAFSKARGKNQRLIILHPSTTSTRPIVRAITRLLQETFRGRLVRLRGARKCSGRGTVC
jgi:hypothetical protein